MPTNLEYELKIKSLSRLYYGLYVYGRQSTDVDLSDLEQAGRIAVFNISRKRPEMLANPAYVSAAIKYAAIGEIKKMRHKVRQVYLTHQHDEMVPMVDLLPTKERGETAPERLEQMDDLLYQIKQEFSPKEADALDSLVQRCGDVYDLNLSTPPSTETKDRVKIVTAMDLDDEEMIIYAQVLTGARAKFPQEYFSSERRGKELSRKYLDALLKSKSMFLREFAISDGKRDFLDRYRLGYLIKRFYNGQTRNLLLDLDPLLQPEEIFRSSLFAEEVRRIIRKSIERLEDSDVYARGEIELEQLKREVDRLSGREITRCLVRTNAYDVLTSIFGGSPYLMIEYAYPGTYPGHTKRAEEIWQGHNQNCADFFSTGVGPILKLIS